MNNSLALQDHVTIMSEKVYRILPSIEVGLITIIIAGIFFVLDSAKRLFFYLV